MEAARTVVDIAVAHARSIGVSVVVAVVDPAGNPVSFTRMDASPL
ncbi:MAG: heme-binding protein, partial [Acidimicrobiia bacterium]|nr:heme-binding protein [Acidimicrobiia bacterium]